MSTNVWRPAHVDLAIVTALHEELEPVLNLVGGRGAWKQFALGQFIQYHTTFVCGAQSLSVVAGALWKVGGTATTAQVLRLKELNPRLLAMTGICAGWQDKAIQLGDVIVADRAFHGGEGKQTPAGLLPDTRTYQSPPWLIALLNDFAHNQEWSHTISTPRPHSLRYQADWLLCQIAERGAAFPTTESDWKAIAALQVDQQQVKALLQTKGFLNKTGKLTASAQKRLTELRSRNYGTLAPLPDHDQPHVHYKAFASSDAVVAVADPFTDLAKRVRNIGALEMEVAALFAAALESDVPAFAVKGVSDYGTTEKDDLFHTYAAEASARWMHAFLCANAGTLHAVLPGGKSVEPVTMPEAPPQSPVGDARPASEADVPDHVLLEDDPHLEPILAQLQAQHEQLAFYRLQQARGDSSFPTALKIKELNKDIPKLQQQIIDLQVDHVQRLERVARPSAALQARVASLNTEILELRIAIAQAEVYELEEQVRIQAGARKREELGTQLAAKKREFAALRQQLAALTAG